MFYVLNSSFPVCNFNVHHKCQKNVPHLCGINQKLLSEAITEVEVGKTSDTPLVWCNLTLPLRILLTHLILSWSSRATCSLQAQYLKKEDRDRSHIAMSLVYVLMILFLHIDEQMG